MLSKVDAHVNPYTVAATVFCLWSVASRFGFIPGSTLDTVTINEDGDEVHSKQGTWNVTQSLLVAAVVLISYFLLKRKHQATISTVAGGITLPEGASILMPSDVQKANFDSVGGEYGSDSFLQGPPPF